jgi:hypothetical protein
MSDRTEERICLRFCFRLGKMAIEAHEILQKTFKAEELRRTHVFYWFARFRRGEMSVENHYHSVRRSSSRPNENVEKIREKINDGPRDTIDVISEAAGVCWSACQRILTVDLNMTCDAAKFVPRLLTKHEKKLV